MSSDDDDEKTDLTAIADIAEFLHELDPDVDDQLEHGEGDTEETKLPEPEEEAEEEEFPQEFQVSKPEEESNPEIEASAPEDELTQSTSTEEFGTEMDMAPEEEAMEFPEEETTAFSSEVEEEEEE
ncbi:MAG: hypothetical protein DRQ88_04355, partial [Epsilonproteobacteria bacterium]